MTKAVEFENINNLTASKVCIVTSGKHRSKSSIRITNLSISDFSSRSEKASWNSVNSFVIDVSSKSFGSF